MGEADAYEVETVGEMVRQRVRDMHGVELRWEVRRIGHFLPGREVREFMDGEPFMGPV
jgi:UDP-N-acetylmuramate dehydrogenase